MRLFISQGVFFLVDEGDALVHQEPCGSAKELAFATVMIMTKLLAQKCQQLVIEGVCIWPVTQRSSLEEILLPLFED